MSTGLTEIIQLNSLVPMLSTSIALNMAFLNIGVFQYLNAIKKMMSDALSEIEGNGTEWFKQLKAMAQVQTDDSEKAKQKVEHQPFFEKIKSKKWWWVASPDLWGLFYNLIFYWKIGRAGSLAATGFGIITVTLITGFNSGALASSSRDLFGMHIPSLFFWGLTSMLWPIFCISMGSWIKRKAASWLQYQTAGFGAEGQEKFQKKIGGAKPAVRKIEK